jgi:hypothetical protein
MRYTSQPGREGRSLPKRVVPKGEGERVPVMTRVTKELRERLEKAASDSGRSLGQEVEFRLTRDFSWEDTKADIGRMREEAAAERDAARIQAIRDAGLQLVREAGGHTVNVSLELLHATADGIVRSGFFDPADPRNERWKPLGAEQLEPTPAAATPALDEEAVYRAVVRALRDAKTEDEPRA